MSLEQNESHDSGEKFNGNHVEQRDVAPTRSGYGHRAKRHCSRWWWVHLIIFCVIFLIIALCLVYVAMPKIAQHGVDESTIEVTNLEFLDPTSDSVVMTQAATLHSPSIFTPTLDPFNASLYLVTKGKFGTVPMTMLLMPKIHALHPKSNASVVAQNVSILSLDQLTQYATQVVSQENVTTALVGKTQLHEGHLPVSTVNYNSSSTYKGLNGLQGFNVTDVRVNLTAKAGTPNLSGNAFIPNPSFMTIAMGNVTLSLSTAVAGLVGNATINNFMLIPGNNSLPMTGIVNQTLMTQSMNSSGFVELQITGTDAIYNGQHLTYYEKALSSNVLTLAMNVKQVIADSIAT